MESNTEGYPTSNTAFYPYTQRHAHLSTYVHIWHASYQIHIQTTHMLLKIIKDRAALIECMAKKKKRPRKTPRLPCVYKPVGTPYVLYNSVENVKSKV